MKIVKVILLGIAVFAENTWLLFAPGDETNLILGLRGEVDLFAQVDSCRHYQEKIRTLKEALEQAGIDDDIEKIQKILKKIYDFQNETASLLLDAARKAQKIFAKIEKLSEASIIQETADKGTFIFAANEAKNELAVVLPQAGLLVQEKIAEIMSSANMIEHYDEALQAHAQAKIIAKAVKIIFTRDRDNFYERQNRVWQEKHRMSAAVTIFNWRNKAVQSVEYTIASILILLCVSGGEAGVQEAMAAVENLKTTEGEPIVGIEKVEPEIRAETVSLEEITRAKSTTTQLCASQQTEGEVITRPQTSESELIREAIRKAFEDAGQSVMNRVATARAAINEAGAARNICPTTQENPTMVGAVIGVRVTVPTTVTTTFNNTFNGDMHLHNSMGLFSSSSSSSSSR